MGTNLGLALTDVLCSRHHPYVATVCGDLGNLFFKLAKKSNDPAELLAKSKAQLQRAMGIRKATLGDQHPFYAT